MCLYVSCVKGVSSDFSPVKDQQRRWQCFWTWGNTAGIISFLPDMRYGHENELLCGFNGCKIHHLDKLRLLNPSNTTGDLSVVFNKKLNNCVAAINSVSCTFHYRGLDLSRFTIILSHSQCLQIKDTIPHLVAEWDFTHL